MRKAVVLALGLAWCAAALAMPPMPGTRLPEPTKGLAGFECPNPDAYNILKGKDGSQVAVAVLTKGTKRYPVLLVDFTDRQFHIAKGKFDTLLFVPNVLSSGSLVDYYREVSYNKDTVTGSCYGWFHSANSQVYYGAGAYGLGSYPRNAPGLVHEVVQLANSTVDFSTFSQNPPGKLELLIIVHAGPGAEGKPDSTNWIWSHNGVLSQMGSAGGGTISVDGITIDNYTMQPEISALDTTYRTLQIEIGVFAHELGHALGLPDLYDVDGSSEGVGRYCLMSSGSWGVDYYNSTPHRPAHLSPWCKKFLGWISPQVIGSDTIGLKLPPVQSTGQVLRLNTPAANEYFLIENRQWNGFDSLLDGEGILIWHQDETVITNGFPSNQINVTESHKGVDLEQAKGTQSLDFPASSNWATYNRGDWKDFYPYLTNNAFADYTTPNSKTYTNASSGVAVTNMAAGLGDTMVLDIGIPGFVIGLLQSPAFPQYLTVAAVANSGLYRPNSIDTALMQNPSGNQTLGFARIGTTRSYQVDYELTVAGSYNVHLAAKDSLDTTRVRRADRRFEVVSGKASGGIASAMGGEMQLDFAPGALSRDLLLAVVEGAEAQPPEAEAISQAVQIGPPLSLGTVCQLAMGCHPGRLGQKDPARLGIYRFEGGAWQYLGGVLDESHGRVLAEIDRLGTYQLAWSPENPPLARLHSGAASGAKPNPFGTRTTISYQLARPSKVLLKIYNAAGQLVKNLEQGLKPAGLHRAAWDGTDDGGRKVASGVYLYRLEADGAVKSGRMAKVR